MPIPESHRENFVGLALAGASAIATYYLLKCINGKYVSNILLQDPTTKYRVKLVDRVHLNEDIIKLTFAFKNKNATLGIETGQHLQISAEVAGKGVTRHYTPVSSIQEKGVFTIILKVYQPTQSEPNRGIMTRTLNDMEIGNEIVVRGPIGQSVYLGLGQWKLRQRSEMKEHRVRAMGLVAGGTGITPMLQIINRVLSDPCDTTKISLVFANHSENDVFLKDELNSLAEKNPEQLRVWYTVSKCDNLKWPFSVGRVDVPMLRDHLPSPSTEVIAFVCGPRGFTKSVVSCLGRIGYDVENDVVQF